MKFLATLNKRYYVVLEAESQTDAYRKLANKSDLQVVKEATCEDVMRIENIREVK